MDLSLNLSVFQEPRGVMRILHFVFSICAFATITGYSGYVDVQCKDDDFKFVYDYPFKLTVDSHPFKVANGTKCHPNVTILGDFSSDAKFFVASGVLAMLYSLAIMIVYTKMDALYRGNDRIPILDFILTVFLAVLWLSSSAAWANGLTGLKHVTDPDNVWEETTNDCVKCPVSASSHSSLNISVIFGFLNFFLWAADLWFLYKETVWFKGPQPDQGEGVKM